ncbi:MAG: group 1 glycosyl transferase [Bacteroidetes bacterium]|nr:MAG: group 1 glycosyl transferase [Bacteroidota bacterium]
MQRICNSLQAAAYDVILVGRKWKDSPELFTTTFRQIRLTCIFKKGKIAYLEYNFKLFFFLLFRKIDLICAIDLDTILPCYFISKIKRIPRVYDAHELFCEMKEVVSRPMIHKIWKRIEKFTVPKFRHGYTVNEMIAEEFRKMYGLSYETIKNVPRLKEMERPQEDGQGFIIYQGAVNEGRSFETLIPAMKDVNSILKIYGDGNFLEQSKNLVQNLGLENKIKFEGKLKPTDLKKITAEAKIGMTLFENNGLSNYYSLANRFFDYIHAEIPQVCVDYPCYHQINEKFEIGLLIKEPTQEEISRAANNLLQDQVLYKRLKENCRKAKQVLNWQTEEIKLIAFYKNIFR